MAKRRGVTAGGARRLLLTFPGVEEGSSYGTAGFKVRGKFLARFRDEDSVLVVKCGDIERDLRIQADPRAFFSMPHYHDYPIVLVKLDAVREDDLHDVIEEGWVRLAPKRLKAERHASVVTGAKDAPPSARE
jgi:hypothetical protein